MDISPGHIIGPYQIIFIAISTVFSKTLLLPIFFLIFNRKRNLQPMNMKKLYRKWNLKVKVTLKEVKVTREEVDFKNVGNL